MDWMLRSVKPDYKYKSHGQVVPYAGQGGSNIDTSFGANNKFVGNQESILNDFNNEQGDFKPISSNKRFRGESEEMGDVQMDDTTAKSGSGGSSAPGPKGALIGKTQTHKGTEYYLHERQQCHSKKTRSLILLWHFTIWDQGNITANNVLKLYSYGTQGLTCLPHSEYVDNILSASNVAQPYLAQSVANSNNKGFSDLVVSQALNFYLDDFFDKKLYNRVNQTGIFSNYNKLRLSSITVTITPRTYVGGTYDQAPWIFERSEAGLVTASGLFQDKNFNRFKVNTEMHEIDMDYWVYRDLYGAYANSTSTLIPTNYLESTGLKPAISRSARTISAHDNNLDYMSNKKPFSFTREVSSTGNYFISTATLQNNYGNPIHALINELEGQIGTTSYINKFPEYLGLLIVPRQMPVQMIGPTIIKGGSAPGQYGYVVDAAYHTLLEVKFNAKWECFDYKHGDYPGPTTFVSNKEVYMDPLIFAEREFMAEKELFNMQNNTNKI